MVLVKIKQFLVGYDGVGFLVVMMVLVKIKQFLVGYDGDG